MTGHEPGCLLVGHSPNPPSKTLVSSQFVGRVISCLFVTRPTGGAIPIATVVGRNWFLLVFPTGAVKPKSVNVTRKN